jgi:hypothetical protein
MVDVLLLELLVRELDLAVKVLKSCGLAKAEELVVDEAILEVVKLVNVLHNLLRFSLYKVLDKRISANGNPKANVAVDLGTREEPGTLTQGGALFSRLGIEPKTPGWLVQDPSTSPSEDLIQYEQYVCVLLLQDLLQSCSRGGRRRVEDMCYETTFSESVFRIRFYVFEWRILKTKKRILKTNSDNTYKGLQNKCTGTK